MPLKSKANKSGANYAAGRGFQENQDPPWGLDIPWTLNVRPPPQTQIAVTTLFTISNGFELDSKGISEHPKTAQIHCVWGENDRTMDG